MNKNLVHEPVLLDEVIKNLHIKNYAQYIDATLGAGGHAVEIIKKGGKVLGIDDDQNMLEIAKKRIKAACLALNRDIEGCFKTAHGNFRNIAAIAIDNGFSQVYGILMDLGLSSVHYDMDERGFSFEDPDDPLDMRLNVGAQNIKASDLLNVLNETQLANMFSAVIGQKKSRELAKEVLKKRENKSFETVGDLVAVSQKVMPKSKINPATKPFMALRIAVNTELENLELALPQAFNLLKEGGVLEVISFHSLEDREVKHQFQELSKSGKAKLINEKPITPSEEELEQNPRSRSAKLRIIQKI